MEKVLKKSPVIGFVRYSQKIDFGDPHKDVFEASYFEYRFEIFKKVTLKSFQQQTDQNFVLLLLHSEKMPAHYQEQFLELEKCNNFLYNIFLEDSLDSFYEALRKSIDYVSFEDNTAVSFRIDNDDAVHSDFIQNLHRFAKKDFIGCAITLPRIIIIKRVSGRSYMVENRYYPSNSIGLAYVTDRTQYKTIMHESQHHLVNDTNPLMVLAKNEVAGLQTINGENAINTIDSNNAKIFSVEEIEEYLSEHKFYELNLDCLRIFPAEKKTVKVLITKGIILCIPPLFITILEKLKKRKN